MNALLLIASLFIWSFRSAEIVTLETGWYYVTDNAQVDAERTLFGSMEVYYLNPIRITGPKDFNKYISLDSFYSENQFQYELRLSSDRVGSILFKEATENASLKNYKLGFLYMDTLIQVSKINGVVHNGTFSISNKKLNKTDLLALKNKIMVEIGEAKD